MIGLDSGRADVVIVGGGLAGLSAGVHLAEDGILVTILEKGTESRYPCNSRYSGGGFQLAFRNMRTSPDELYEHLKTTSHAGSDIAQLRALADDAGSTLDWLAAHGASFGVGGPAEFMSNMLQPFSLRETGLAGHWAGKGADRLVEQLGQRLVQAGGSLLRGHRADHLRVERGAVVGVEVSTGDHTTEGIQARAVVLADGGFQGNLDLLREHVCSQPERLLQRGPATGQGDGLRMAAEVGAGVVGLDRFYGHVQVREAMQSSRFWPYPLLDIVASAGILVDSSGHRFVDEGLGGIFCANAIGKLDDPLSAVLIMDSDIWNGPGRQFVLPPNPALLDPEVTLSSADTVADLARQVELPVSELVETVSVYNQAIIDGSGYALHPARSSERSLLALSAQPIQKPPFLAFRVCAGITYTTGGVVVDQDGRVLGQNGDPISGLYAAGSVTGGLEGGPQSVYIGGLAKASIFGLRAARAIGAQLKTRQHSE